MNNWVRPSGIHTGFVSSEFPLVMRFARPSSVVNTTRC
jgi:hypothetical protein